jgi:hypothetical protein
MLWATGALAALVALFCVLLGTALPFQLHTQALDDRVYYLQLEQVARYIDEDDRRRTGPHDIVVIRQVVASRSNPIIASSLVIDPADCDGGFTKSPGDHFVLGFWRGEWTECYSYPSGQTTLPRSTLVYLGSGLGLSLGLLWIIALVACWATWRLFRAASRDWAVRTP